MVKVRHAVILAAGAATRFVPLSLEQPKGLYEVNGKRLIDRQIEQLQEAGVKVRLRYDDQLREALTKPAISW